jgi:hypothetical protein
MIIHGFKEEEMSSTTDLDALLKRPTPQDVIGAIFAYSELEAFPSDRKKLHGFMRLKKDGEGADLLAPFVFSDGVDLYPFSRLLESVLMQLQLGGWLSAKNPEYNRFGLTSDIREDIKEKVSRRFSPEQLSVLKRLGKEFGDFINRQG